MSLAQAKITTHCFTHIGQRDQNQDRLAVLESPHNGSRLLVIADGLGGHTGGLLAAQTIVATAERCWRLRSADTAEATAQATPEATSETGPETCQPSTSSGQSYGQSPEKFLKLFVRECHDAMRHAGREQGLDPHSTIAALLLQDGQAISVHAGDSRVMQYSESSFVDRTLDHSVAQLHALRGTITDDEMAEHPDQNKLFAQVGGPTGPEAEIKRWDLSEGRRFVLCSDGFWEIFRHDEIVEMFMSDDPEAELKGRFEHKLRQLEHHDNTTAILAEVMPGEAIPNEVLSEDEIPTYTTSADMALAGDTVGGETPVGETLADESAAQVLAPHGHRRQGQTGRARASVAGVALIVLLHAAGLAFGQGEGGESSQDEDVPVSTTQGELPGVPGGGERAAGGTDSVDGNAEPGGLPDGQRESSPIRLQSSNIALNLAIEPGEDITEAVAEELRQRGRLGVGDSLANVSGPRELGESTVIRMRQEHRGIPVFAAEVVVSTLEGRIVRVAGDSIPDLRLDSTVPVNDYGSTITLAEMLTGLAITPRDDGALVVFPADNGGRLAWSGPALVEQGLEQNPEELTGQNLAQSLEHLHLDSANGEILLRLPLVRQVLDRRIHDFSQACRDAGIRRPMNARTAMVRALTLIQASPLVRSEAVGGWHRNAERLFDTFGAYYRFLRLILDIDSIDDDGKPLVGYIGARFDERIPGVPQCSGDEFMAFWIPSDAVILTDAVLDFPELIGHEATHGLIGHGSGLIYQYESGALHESIADALGVAFRGWNEGAARQDMAAEVAMGAVNWQIRGPSSVIRALQSPGSVTLPDGTPLPDHFDDYMYLPADVDNGGVHVNSSIMNHGFYLLAAGGRHTRLRHDPAVEGIGIMKAARIFGAAGAWLLAPASDFEDARHAFAHAAETIHGEDSMEWAAVHTAMDAIGIPGTWEQPPKPESEPTEPIAEPESPAPVPVSGTSPVPQSPAEPQNSTNPQDLATPETPFPPSMPAPAPMAAPPPAQAPAQEPTSAGDGSRNRAAALGQPLALFLVAVLALAGAAIVVYAYRPGGSSPMRWKPVSQKSRDSAAPTPESGSQAVSPPAPGRLGTLQPEDGTTAIPLERGTLVSSEGLVVGRAAGICHVELSNPAVSRRHVRLRLADEAIIVEDLNSAAGTRLDGAALKPFKPRRVNAGQTLNIAGLVYRIDIV